jgi:excisionase family DNA binding protein
MKLINSGCHQAIGRESRQLTTGEAAGLCSVQPDTVLKWIKKGQLRAAQTAGGHHRIAYRDLESFLRAHRVGGEISPPGETTSHPVRCWEFFSNQGVLRDACKECVVYRVRAALCFELLGPGKEVGHARLFCQNSCEDCAYYRRVKGLKLNVLVVSQDEDLIRDLAGERSEDLSLRFARNGYEASAAIHEFRPAFAVVDRDLIPDGGNELLECLTNDPRVPGLKIILAVPGGGRRRRREPGKGAMEVLVKPFGLDQVAAVVNMLPVESAEVELPVSSALQSAS